MLLATNRFSANRAAPYANERNSSCLDAAGSPRREARMGFQKLFSWLTRAYQNGQALSSQNFSVILLN
jgi:hypothetical protein